MHLTIFSACSNSIALQNQRNPKNTSGHVEITWHQQTGQAQHNKITSLVYRSDVL